MFAPLSSSAAKGCEIWGNYKNLLQGKLRLSGEFEPDLQGGEIGLGRFMLLGRCCLARGKFREQHQKESVGKSKDEFQGTG